MTQTFKQIADDQTQESWTDKDHLRFMTMNYWSAIDKVNKANFRNQNLRNEIDSLEDNLLDAYRDMKKAKDRAFLLGMLFGAAALTGTLSFVLALANL